MLDASVASSAEVEVYASWALIMVRMIYGSVGADPSTIVQNKLHSAVAEPELTPLNLSYMRRLKQIIRHPLSSNSSGSGQLRGDATLPLQTSQMDVGFRRLSLDYRHIQRRKLQILSDAMRVVLGDALGEHGFLSALKKGDASVDVTVCPATGLPKGIFAETPENAAAFSTLRPNVA